MILRRMSEALRARDWLGVLLEVLIVVIGILIGLQVDDWNQARQARVLESEYLERLWIEAENNNKALDRIISLYSSNLDEMGDALSYLLSDGSDSVLLARIKESGVKTGRLPSFMLEDSAYEELVSAGRLGLIRNVKLRQALQRVKVAEREQEGQLNYFRDANLSMREYKRENFNDESIVKDVTDRIQIETHIERYLGDEKYARLLASHIEIQYKLRWSVGEIRDANLKAMSLLACELKRPECSTVGEKEPVTQSMDE